MEAMEALFYGFVLGAVEGLTEFIPVSSTGHLIIAGEILNFTGETAKTFEVVIQFAAILAIVWLYRDRFLGLLKPRLDRRFSGMRGLWLLFLTTVPPGIAGLLFHSTIKKYLFNPASVALALAVGAVCMLLIEARGERRKIVSLDMVTPALALGIGFFQCLALYPGFSRSAATIIGGMLLGARRKVAAEYSFIAAVPLMTAATAYDLFKSWDHLSMDDLPLFLWGGLFSFIFAIIAVKGFISLLGRVTLRPFAIYRLAIAPLVYWFLAA